MTKAKNEYREIRDIKNDLDSLKSNVVALTRHLEKDGMQKAMDLTDGLQERAYDVTGKFVAEGEREMHMIEKRVQANPAKSMLFAFGVGILANALLTRR